MAYFVFEPIFKDTFHTFLSNPCLLNLETLNLRGELVAFASGKQEKARARCFQYQFLLFPTLIS